MGRVLVRWGGSGEVVTILGEEEFQAWEDGGVSPSAKALKMKLAKVQGVNGSRFQMRLLRGSLATWE